MADINAILEELPLLRFLPPDSQELVRNAFTAQTFPFGATIVREGERGDAYYVLTAGRARVVKTTEGGEELPLNVLRPGDGFGEMALLDASTRAATVRASSEVEVLRLDKSVFDALVRSRPEIREYLELQVKQRHLHAFLTEFTPFAKLPIATLRALVESLEPLDVPAGEMIFREGDPPGPLFIVEDGRLRVFTQGDGRRHNVGYLRKGDFFGEVSALSEAPRAESVEAVSPCRLLVLRPAAYQRLLDGQPEFRAQIEARLPTYAHRHTALFPLDFAKELLPAEVSAHEKVGLDQVRATIDMTTAEIDAALAAKANGRRNGRDGTHAAPRVEAPFADDGHFVKAPKRIRTFKHVRQVDEMDCGAACMAMVCQHYGRAVTLARIRRLVHTSLDGTSLRAIATAATELGLAARTVKSSERHLGQMPLPAIVHWEGNHWVVLYDVDKTHVRIADPATGRRRMRREDFVAAWTGYAALFDYTTELTKQPESRARGAWLWAFIRPWARVGAQALGLALVASLLQMVLPVFTQLIIDRVLVEQDRQLLQVLVIGMGMVLAFMTLSSVLQRYLLSFVAVRVDTASLDFLTRRLLSLPMSYFNTRRTGDIRRRLEGMRSIRDYLVTYGVSALTAATLLVATVGLMLVYSPFLTAMFASVVPLYAVLMVMSRRWLQPLYDELEKAFGTYGSQQIDAIKGIETVKVLGAEGAFRDRMLSDFTALANKRFRADFTLLGYDAGVNLLTVLSLIIFLWAGSGQVLAGKMTVGAFVAFNSLVALANPQIVAILTTWDVYQYASVLLARLDDVLEEEPEQGEGEARARLTPVPTLEGRISFRNVSFRYGGPESPPILDGISFDVTPNKTVAIVGRSGSGKTTLIKCLAGLLEPTDGTIHYDGLELRSLNYRELRRNIGVVMQENHLFDDTIARNVAFGELDPDMDAVIWAARAANAHEFIERLPLGYDTKIGESGLGLSGGQRQRISIARALYHRPPVLVFDEATSALDSESERAVQENMARLLEGHTAFVIAHRLSTVRDADTILVIERGRLVEQGSHDELIARQGLYYYLCSQQLSL